jgi:glycosyltransferase involved in cell wall biosynthesis
MSRKVKVRDVLHDALLLSRWVREGKPDLLHAGFAHDHHLCLWAAFRAGRAREELRVVRTAHRREDIAPGPLRRRTRALRATDGVVVHCESYRNELIRQGIPSQRILHLPGAVDAARFTPGRAEHLRRQWGVPPDARLAGIVSRMKPERNHRQLLLGFAQAAALVSDAWLVLVGRGESEEPLRAQAASLPAGVARRIVFGGYLRGEGLVDAYRALDAAAWLREGNDGACRGVLEAMACGVPVIVGNDGAPAELVRDGRDGRLVDASSPDSIKAAIIEILGDLPRARDLGQSARGRAEEHTPERYGRTLLAFYRLLRALPPVGLSGKPIAHRRGKRKDF